MICREVHTVEENRLCHVITVTVLLSCCLAVLLSCCLAVLLFYRTISLSQ